MRCLTGWGRWCTIDPRSGGKPFDRSTLFLIEMTNYVYDKPIIDPRPLDPPEYWDEEENIETTFIVDSHHGIYIPQIFCQSYEKVDNVCQEDWDICLSGPDHEWYWDAWSEILNSWNYKESDALGSIFEVFIDQQDGDLFQCRRFLYNE